LMKDLLEINDRLTRAGKLGPAARLGATAQAVTLRGPGDGMVIDGPFAETKEQLLGLYVIDCANQDEAIAVARDLRRVNPTAVYEIRPIMLYLPGAP
ncbi:YciI family protein, partial [Mesorhizobium sp. M1D.F.Ca.ET.183.01.1.1]